MHNSSGESQNSLEHLVQAVREACQKKSVWRVDDYTLADAGVEPRDYLYWDSERQELLHGVWRRH